MRADKLLLPSKTTTSKEVAMVKRIAVLAIVLAAFLIVAVPALAFNGARADYTTSAACAVCHTAGQPAGAPKVYNEWAGTGHANSITASQNTSIPTGSVCAGCHVGNYDPTKVVPTPTATSTSGTISWAASIPSPFPAQTAGSAPYSEPDVGCSSCHYGAAMGGDLAQDGSDANDTAHTAPFGDLANAEICGACHSRFSYTVGTYVVQNTATSMATIQPQMAIGYPMLGQAYQPLSNFLNVATPGWTPTPTATTTGFPNLQTYWTVAGQSTVWPQSGHDGDAAQYPEWLSSKHADSLTDLKAATGGNPPQACLACHSADYQIAVAANAAFPGLDAGVPTGSQAKYGDTCVSCHTPHDAGMANGAWQSEYDTQLVGDPANPSDLCTTCHTAAITAANGIEPAGATVYEDQKEVMNGTGAIGVPQGLPGVHDGKCVECHMVPTTYGRGAAQLGGNHTMEIVTPQDAVDASPVPIATATAKATATPTPSGTPVVTTTLTVTQGSMPYSACSTCHNNNVTSTPQPVSTATTTPSPSASPIQVTVTVTQNAAGGDKGMWLQNTIEQRQAAMQAAYNNVAAALHSAGLRMGYAQPAAAAEAAATSSWVYLQNKQLNAAKNSTAADASYVDWLNAQLNTKGSAKWSSAELLWQEGYTDWTYVAAEGSWGIHNYQYDSLVIQAALNYANMVGSTPQAVTLKASMKTVMLKTKVTFSGTVKPASVGTLTIQKKSGKNWLKWKTAKVGTNGKYSLKVKMTKKGMYTLRAFFPATPPNAGGTSSQIKVVVK